MKWELEPRPDNTQPTEPTSSERYSATTRLPPYPERPESFDFSLLWGTFWQWKFPLIALILAVTAAAWAASGLLSPRYEAAALIRLASDDLDVLGEGRRDPRGYIDPVALESQVRAVKGAEILKDAAQAVGLRYYNEFNGAFFPKFSLFGISAFFKSDEDRGRFGESEDETAVSTIVAALDRAAEVTQLGKSGIAQISILSQDPRLAALTVNEIGEGYIESQLLRARARRLQGLDALVAQQAELQKRLRDVEEDIVQIREGNQLLFSEEPAAASSAFASLREKLIESEAELVQAEHRYQSISEGKPGRGEANREIEFSPLIQALRQQRAALMIESTAISPDIGPLHPRMIAAKERVADVDRIIGEEVERLRSAVKNEAESLRKKVEDLRAHLASMQGEIQGQTKSRIHLTGLLAQSEALRASIETLKGQIDRIEAEIALQQSSADFISRAVPPSKPSYPKRKMIAGGAFVGVTGLSVLFVVGLALTDRRIKSVKQINLMEASIGYPVLGVLPLHTTLKLDPRTLDVDSLYMRSVAAITGALGINQNTLTTMGVYPLCPRDGGTSFSISLALCCSRMSLKTLLIELDSSGEITRHFGVEQDRSMPALADDQSDPTTSLWATDSPDLHLLQFNTVGCSLYGNELEAVGRTMNSVKSIYEVIIVDAPALAKEPYALRLAEWLDQVLVVSQADISRIELLKYKLRAMRLWPHMRTGIVLNGVSNERLML